MSPVIRRRFTFHQWVFHTAPWGDDGTMSQLRLSAKEAVLSGAWASYLPGRGDTMITKVVHPRRGSAIALRLLLTRANSPNVGISTA